MSRRVARVAALAMSALAIAGIGCRSRSVDAVAIVADQRPAAWAAPTQAPGLPNLHRVAPGVWRGAQPSAEGMRTLETMGVRTVVNLRGFHSDRDELVGTGLSYVHVRFNTWNPEDEDVVAFLKVVADPARQPVFVHCQHGADRTGMMCALYRMTVQGWTVDEAIAEMTRGGYGFHPIWRNLPVYLRQVDAERLRRMAGLPEPQAAAAAASADR